MEPVDRVPPRKMSLPEDVRAQIAFLEARLLDIENQSAELSRQVNSSESASMADSTIHTEVEILRSRKRSEDEQRNQIRQQSKALDNQKRGLEHELRKVERTLKLEKDAQQQKLNDECEKKEEIEIMKRKMARDDQRASESRERKEATLSFLNNNIEEKRKKLEELEAEITILTRNHRELEDQVKKVQNDLERVRDSEDIAIPDIDAKEETFHYAEERYNIAIERYAALESQHRSLHAKLGTLLQLKTDKKKDLLRIRRWAEIDRLSSVSLAHNVDDLPSTPIENNSDVFSDRQVQTDAFSRRGSNGGIRYPWITNPNDLDRPRSFSPSFNSSINRISPQLKSPLSSENSFFDNQSYSSLLPSSLISDVEMPRQASPLSSPHDPISPFRQGQFGTRSNGFGEETSFFDTQILRSSHAEFEQKQIPKSFAENGIFSSVSSEASLKFSDSVFVPQINNVCRPISKSPLSSLNGVPIERTESPVQKPDPLRAPGANTLTRDYSTPLDVDTRRRSDVLTASSSEIMNDRGDKMPNPFMSQMGGIGTGGFGLWDSRFNADMTNVWKSNFSKSKGDESPRFE